MTKAPADQFYYGDWLNDVELQAASASTRGIWINALARMWFAKEKGELVGPEEKFPQLLNCTKDEFDLFLRENEALLFCYLSRNGNGILTLRNRRMFRQEKERKSNRLRQARFKQKKKGNAKGNGEITPPSSSSYKKEKKKKDLVTAKRVLEYLNEIGGKKFTATEANLTPIIARLEEGHTEEECKKVIEIKARDPDFQDKYFRPVTLFRASKFEGYLNEKPKQKERIW